MRSSRRQFLMGCSTAVAAMTGSRLGYLGWADAQVPDENRETLVIVFLRGGMDGLSLLPPISGADRGYYEAARPVLRIPLVGAGAALPLNDRFGLHPSAASMRSLFQSGNLAVIQAVGSSGSRSHFDAQKYLELGTPGVKTTTDGWLTRHLASSPALPPNITLPALATGSLPPASLQGNREFVNMVDASTFALGQIGNPSWAAGDQWVALRRLFGLEDTFLHTAGVQALNAAGLVESYVQSNYTPAGGAVYPIGEFGQQMKLLAQLIKSDIGLRVATVDLGGWDTHENQGNQPAGHFSSQVQRLSDGVTALYTDLDTSGANAPIKRVTVVVLSEFGRRVRENANLGTDHGTGNPVFVLGGNVRGGVYGDWPGLHPDQLYDSADVAPTTDLRRVLSEILIRRTGNPRLGEVFPKYSEYSPLNIVTGKDITPDYTFAIPVTPADFAAKRIAETVVRLTWTRTAHATNYRIERQDGLLPLLAPWEHVAIVGGDTVRHDDNNAPPGINPIYRLQAFNSHGDGFFVTRPTVAASGDPLLAWRMQYFGTSANTGSSADGAVSSSDRLSNFAKYALGLDPLAPARAATAGYTPGLPRLELSAATAALVFVRPLDRTNVSYEVLTSTDLKSWTPLAQVSEGTSNGFERLRAETVSRDPVRQYLKLTVQPN